MVHLSHLSAKSWRALSRKRPPVSLSEVLQIGLSLSVSIAKSELWSSGPDGELSRTGQTECYVRGDMMISTETLHFHPGFYPCHYTSHHTVGPMRAAKQTAYEYLRKPYIKADIRPCVKPN